MATPRSNASGGVSKWVSGRTYAPDIVVWSPDSYLQYIRLTTGGGTTDPSADTTNWALFGQTRAKATRTVEAVLVSTGLAVTLTPPVNPDKTRMCLVGSQVSPGSALSDAFATPELAVDGSDVTFSRPTAGGTLTLRLEIYEDY